MFEGIVLICQFALVFSATELSEFRVSSDQGSDFASLDSAIALTASLPSTQLTLSPAQPLFPITQPALISRNLTITGQPQTHITLSSTLTLAVEGYLCFRNVTITDTDANSKGDMHIFGRFDLIDVNIVNISSTFIHFSDQFRLYNVTVTNISSVLMTVLPGNPHFQLYNSSISSLTATFLQLKLNFNEVSNVNLMISECKFWNNSFESENYLFNLEGNIGRIEVKNTVFEGNFGVLFYVNGLKMNGNFHNCDFKSNFGVLIFGYLRDSLIEISANLFKNNSDVAINLLDFQGNLTISGCEITDQHFKGLFRFLSRGDSSRCVTHILHSHFHDIHLTSLSDTPGLLHLQYCTCTLSNLTISNVLIIAMLHNQVNSLIGGVMSVMYMTNIWVNNSGTAGYLVGMNIGSLYVSELYCENAHTGEGVYIGSSDGAVWIRNSQFKGGYFHNYGLKRLFDYNPIYIGVLVSTLRLDNITIHHSETTMGMAFGAFQAKFTVKDLHLSDLSLGSAFVTSHSNGSITNLTINRLEMDMHTIQLGSQSNVTLKEVKMTNSRVIRKDRGVFQTSMHSFLTVSDLVLTNFNASGFIRAKQSQIYMENVRIFDCFVDCLLNYPLFSVISMSILRVKNTNSRLFFSIDSQISLHELMIEDLYSPGMVMGGINSTILISNSHFRDLVTTAELGKLTGHSQFQVLNSSFSGFTVMGMMGWSIIDSHLTVSFSQFHRINSLVFHGHFSDITVLNSSFSDIKNTVKSLRSNEAFGGAIGCMDCVSVRMEGVVVENVTAEVGGAVAVQRGQRGPEGKLVVRGSRFERCAATKGGALYVDSVSFTVETSLFKGNKADFTGGGLDVYLHPWQSGTIHNCTFLLNSAISGGGIKWHSHEVLLSHVHFLYNFAQYGPDIASYGVNLTASLSNLTYPQVSGSPSNIIFALLDHYGQKVTVSTFKFVLLTTTEQVSYRGNQMGVLSNGVFNFSQLTIYAPPETTQVIEAVLNDTQGDYNLNIVGRVKVTFRDCIPGEIKRNDRCEQCYSGNVSTTPSDSECSFCPPHADCPGGHTLIVDSGYWRSDSHSLSLIECLLPEKCLGGDNSTCLDGYTGLLCNQCKSGWSRSRVIDCTECGHAGLLTLQVVTEAGVFMVFVWVVLRLGAYRPNPYKLFVIKSQLHYFQLMACLAYTRVSFSPQITWYFQAVPYLSSLLIPDFPYSCMSISAPEYAQAITGSCLLPCLVLLGILICRTTTYAWKSNVLTLTFSLFLFTPFIVLQSTLPLLSCGSISGSETGYMYFDLNTKCWQGTHWKYVVLLVIPSFIVNICVPMAVILVLRVIKYRVFRRFCVIWTCGQACAAWDLFLCCMKLLLLTVTVLSYTSPPLAQFAYVLSFLTTTSILSVSLSEYVFETDRLFLVSQGGLLVTTLSAGILGYYVFYKPGENASEYVGIALFLAVNGLFVGLTTWLLTRKQAGRWLSTKIARPSSPVNIVTVEMHSEPKESEIIPPQNSFQSMNSAG